LHRERRSGRAEIAKGSAGHGVEGAGERQMGTVRSVAVASDHNGYRYKEEIKDFLRKNGYSVTDFGQDTETPARDFEAAEKVALSVARGVADRGILICGSGAGMCIAANKVPGVFAALCFDSFTAESAAERNDANVITLGSKTVGLDTAKEIVRVWLGAEFAGGPGDERNVVRNSHLRELDSRYRKQGT
jgi:ribose 5-phosphate isomerase B